MFELEDGTRIAVRPSIKTKKWNRTTCLHTASRQSKKSPAHALTGSKRKLESTWTTSGIGCEKTPIRAWAQAMHSRRCCYLRPKGCLSCRARSRDISRSRRCRNTKRFLDFARNEKNLVFWAWLAQSVVEFFALPALPRSI